MSDGNKANSGSIFGLAAKLIVGGALAAGASYAVYNAAQQFSEQSQSSGTIARPTPTSWDVSSEPVSRTNRQSSTNRANSDSRPPPSRGSPVCTICDGTLLGRNLGRAQPCGHIFHDECVSGRMNCPTCYRQIVSIQ